MKKKNKAEGADRRAVSLPQSSLPEEIPNVFHLFGEIQFSDRHLTIQGDFLNTLNEMLDKIFRRKIRKRERNRKKP